MFQQREEEINQLKQETQRLNKLRETTQRKLRTVEEQKTEIEQQREIHKNQIAAMEKGKCPKLSPYTMVCMICIVYVCISACTIVRVCVQLFMCLYDHAFIHVFV